MHDGNGDEREGEQHRRHHARLIDAEGLHAIVDGNRQDARLAGMLPPIIRMTPNSPSVWANVSATAETIPGHASGSSMRRIVSQRDSPLTKAASRTLRGMASKAR